MRAAKDAARGLDAVADHPATAVRTARSERFDRALERLERVRFAAQRYLEGLVVFVPAGLTFHGHVRQEFVDKSESKGARWPAPRLITKALSALEAVAQIAHPVVSG